MVHQLTLLIDIVTTHQFQLLTVKQTIAITSSSRHYSGSRHYRAEKGEFQLW